MGVFPSLNRRVGAGVGDSEPVTEPTTLRAHRAGGFIERDTELGKGSCHPDRGLLHSMLPMTLAYPPPDFWAASSGKGSYPASSKVPLEGLQSSVQKSIGGTEDSPSRAIMTGLSHPSVHPSIHGPSPPVPRRPSSLATLEPGPMVLLLSQEGDEGVTVGDLQAAAPAQPLLPRGLWREVVQVAAGAPCLALT